jgi:hypothetical protein
MRVGERVAVRIRYNGSWADGFEIVAIEEGGYRVRRRSDGAVLPVTTPADDLRPVVSSAT